MHLLDATSNGALDKLETPVMPFTWNTLFKQEVLLYCLALGEEGDQNQGFSGDREMLTHWGQLSAIKAADSNRYMHTAMKKCTPCPSAM